MSNDKLDLIMAYLDKCVSLAEEKEMDPNNKDQSLYYSIIRSTLVEFRRDAKEIVAGTLIANTDITLN